MAFGLDFGGIATKFLGGLLGDMFGESEEQAAATDLRNAAALARVQKDLHLELMGQSPKAQVQGLIDAGLNPMLAYENVQFPMSGPQMGPMSTSADRMQARAAQRSSLASGESASAASLQARTAERLRQNQADLWKSQKELMKAQETREYSAARLTDYETKQVESLFLATAKFMDPGTFRMSMDEQVDTMADYIKANRLPREVSEAAADVLDNVNRAKLYELLNVPATNQLFRFGQLVIRGMMAVREKR